MKFVMKEEIQQYIELGKAVYDENAALDKECDMLEERHILERKKLEGLKVYLPLADVLLAGVLIICIICRDAVFTLLAVIGFFECIHETVKHDAKMRDFYHDTLAETEALKLKIGERLTDGTRYEIAQNLVTHEFLNCIFKNIVTGGLSNVTFRYEEKISGEILEDDYRIACVFDSQLEEDVFDLDDMVIKLKE